MRTPPLPTAALALLLGGIAPQLTAQAVLVVEHQNKPTPVVLARGSRPFVEENGKIVAASGDRYALVPIEEYLPVFVAVRHVRVGTFHIELINTGGSINNEFRFKGEFESAFPLNDVFVALELFMDDGSKSIFLRDVGNLEPNHPHDLDIAVRTGFPLGKGHHRIHIFSHGRELLHSEQPFTLREKALDRFIAKRLKGRTDGPPEPLIGPPPEYPDKLRKANLAGQVKLKLRVLATGAVLDPSIVSASDPAFGEAAVESMRQWRFFPRIKNGRPTDTVIEMPINFAPPKPAKS